MEIDGASVTASNTQAVKEKTLSNGAGNLVKLLPTGTMFLFQFFNPVLTNNGQYETFNKYLASILLGVCGFSCFFSSFTDSYVGSDKTTHYGIVTLNGIWPSSDLRKDELKKYKLRIEDLVHAFFSLIVFAVVALLDSNTVAYFYPWLEPKQKALLMALPSVVGAFISSAFAMLPNKRHGIGYPPS